MRIFVTIFILSIALSISPLKAAKIELVSDPTVAIDFIFIQGPIVAGDATEFYRLADSTPKRIMVSLESGGGLVNEALQIGAKIRTNNYSTTVFPDKNCYSACALIWIAGIHRYMSGSSHIGVHAAYIRENGQTKELGQPNAVIGSYLTHLDLGIDAISYFTDAGPNDLNRITPDIARRLGIDIYLSKKDGRIITADDMPSVTKSADRFTGYVYLQSQCTSLFDYTPNIFDQYATKEFNNGVALISREKWGKQLEMSGQKFAQKGNDRGVLRACIEVEQDLRSQGLQTFIFGPSFNCSNLSNNALIGICSDKDLWAKDKALNNIYLWTLKNLTKAQRRPFLETQRRWLKYRDNCSNDVDCLNNAYDARIRDLHYVALDSNF